MMGKLEPERPSNLMVKTHGFPVKIFPTKPIQWILVWWFFLHVLHRFNLARSPDGLFWQCRRTIWPSHTHRWKTIYNKSYYHRWWLIDVWYWLNFYNFYGPWESYFFLHQDQEICCFFLKKKVRYRMHLTSFHVTILRWAMELVNYLVDGL